MAKANGETWGCPTCDKKRFPYGEPCPTWATGCENMRTPNINGGWYIADMKRNKMIAEYEQALGMTAHEFLAKRNAGIDLDSFEANHLLDLLIRKHGEWYVNHVQPLDSSQQLAIGIAAISDEDTKASKHDGLD